METKKGFASIDDYIGSFSGETRRILEEIRAVIKAAAPEAEEKISYQMPTFFLKGNLIHFAAFKNHIGIYPTPSGTEAFKEEIAQYKSAKGSIQLPIDKPMPLELIRKIVEFRVADNLGRVEAGPKKQTKGEKK
jgi:uncharacterized protein YdhG (YjbR/CyaY superfamily)